MPRSPGDVCGMGSKREYSSRRLGATRVRRASLGNSHSQRAKPFRYPLSHIETIHAEKRSSQAY